MTKYLFLGLCVCLCLGLPASCSGDAKEETETGETETPGTNTGKTESQGTTELVGRESPADLPTSLDFSFDLLRGVSGKIAGGENVFISPLSANIALSLLANGAAGQTQEDILQALGYGNLPIETVNAYLKDLAVFHPQQPGPVVEQANSVWAIKKMPIEAPFTEALQTFYDAYVWNADFTAEMINRWCDEKTHGLIPELLENADGDAYLVNTLYFKAKWAQPFNPEFTAQEDFTDAQGSARPVATMNRSLRTFAFEGETFDALELDYEGNAFSMVVLLLKGKASVASVIDGLDADAWAGTLRGMYLYDVSLRLPKFEVADKNLLNDVLQKIGLQSIFDESADFSPISPDFEPWVSKIVQKSVAKINEEGTEAAAATYTAGFGSDGPGPAYPSIDFHVDRPFLFFIHEKSTGHILFAGGIQSP